MTGARRRAEVAAFQALLTAVGVLMLLAGRRLDRFRRQVTRDLVIEIRSLDGARQQYRLQASTRRLTLPLRSLPEPDVTLIFATARAGLRALLSRHTVGRIVDGMNTGADRGAVIDMRGALADMVTYNGGRPLTCHA